MTIGVDDPGLEPEPDRVPGQDVLGPLDEPPPFVPLPVPPFVPLTELVFVPLPEPDVAELLAGIAERDADTARWVGGPRTWTPPKVPAGRCGSGSPSS